MAASQTVYLDVSRLSIGLFIHLDLGWMDHPFSLNSFKIRSQDQIDTLRSLGVRQVRCCPEMSDPDVWQTACRLEDSLPGEAIPRPPAQDGGVDELAARRQWLADQRASLQRCERRFGEAARVFRQIFRQAHAQPEGCREQAAALIDGFVGEMLAEQECAIRLLSEKSGDDNTLHALNVTIISLLLGRAAGLSADEMRELGVGALLHDIGKLELPDRLRWQDEQGSLAERQLYREHVAHGVELGRRMRLSPTALLVIAQHHELADGSGFPRQLANDRMSVPGRIVALVNRYDNACNPSNPALALTPHEALSTLFVQMKTRFDKAILALFIRMMGVYPPGSAVQLSDGRYALVASVNSSRPLKPWVVVHDPRFDKEEAPLLNLEQEPALSIKTSFKPLQLPKAVLDYLSPRKRLCYFFDRARDLGEESGS